MAEYTEQRRTARPRSLITTLVGHLIKGIIKFHLVRWRRPFNRNKEGDNDTRGSTKSSRCRRDSAMANGEMTRRMSTEEMSSSHESLTHVAQMEERKAAASIWHLREDSAVMFDVVRRQSYQTSHNRRATACAAL
eukprot:2174223-Pyramimonas_sp.AAC.1